MAVVKDNSLEFALQETAKGFSRSGKSINLKPEPVAASSMEKMFWRFYQLVFARVPYFNCSFVSEYMLKDSACILVICLLRNLMAEQITEERSMGLTANSLPEASLGDMGGF